MPSGVEHITEADGVNTEHLPISAPMPSGVEHAENGHLVRDGKNPISAPMPSGVEHRSPVASEIRFAADLRSDALGR